MKQMPLHVITIMLEAEKVLCFLFHLWNKIISRFKFVVEKYKEIIYTFKFNTVYSFFLFLKRDSFYFFLWCWQICIKEMCGVESISLFYVIALLLMFLNHVTINMAKIPLIPLISQLINLNPVTWKSQNCTLE